MPKYIGRNCHHHNLYEETTIMAINVTPTLRRALHQLETERRRIDHQIAALRSALDGLGSPKGRGVRLRASGSTRRRRRMSATARRALSQRMKAYWAKRRHAKDKSKPKAGRTQSR